MWRSLVQIPLGYQFFLLLVILITYQCFNVFLLLNNYFFSFYQTTKGLRFTFQFSASYDKRFAKGVTTYWCQKNGFQLDLPIFLVLEPNLVPRCALYFFKFCIPNLKVIRSHICALLQLFCKHVKRTKSNFLKVRISSAIYFKSGM